MVTLQLNQPKKSSRVARHTSTSLSLKVIDADAKTTAKKKLSIRTKRLKVNNKTIEKLFKKTNKKKLSNATQTRKIKTTTTKTKVSTKKLVARKTTTKEKNNKVISIDSLNSQKSITYLKRNPLGHLYVEKKLREAGFSGGISSDKKYLDKYSTDESIFSIRPQIVLQPTNKRDVETAVKVIGENTTKFPSLSLTPRAAGTGLSGGSLTDSIVIDVSAHMTKIKTPVTKKKQTTITCEPGALWRDIELTLAKKNVYIPSAPTSKDICTIGGSVANNSAGPDSLKYGHTANWVSSLEVTLYDGSTYKIEPLTYSAFKKLIKKKNAYAEIVNDIFCILVKSEKEILKAKPKTMKNTAGYALWDVLNSSVAEFKKGKGTFNLTRLISGSQGTIGIITSVTLKTKSIENDTTLIVLPIFDLTCAGRLIQQALKYDPLNIEVFDDLTFDLALKNPTFFKKRLSGLSYYKTMLSLYTTYHVRYRRKTPVFTLLITLNKKVVEGEKQKEITSTLQKVGCKVVRFVTAPEEQTMWWQLRSASYPLSKLQDKCKRPAAFLEDMTVPPENLLGFFKDIKKLFKKFNIEAAMHGHGGNGHFHFYPLLDFTAKDTPELIEKMSEEFFTTAVKHKGSICGEHNDGIIRTPHLNKMFPKTILKLFADTEQIFDPFDIFNPGKKVNPRFDIKDSIRKIN